MIKLLLDHGADTSLLCNGHSPLSLAIVSGNDNVSYTLITSTYSRRRRRIVVKQAQAYGLYAPLFLHFTIINQITTHILTLHYGFRFLVVVHENS